MNSNETKLNEILKKRGVDMAVVDNTAETEIPDSSEAFKHIVGIYYDVKVSADMEIPYWYNRAWWEHEGEVHEVRRAKALRAALSHATPNIIPGDKLAMAKTKNMRGAFPFPWVMSSFFNGNAEELLNSAIAPVDTAEAISQVGAGGGNVSESYGEIISLGSKFGMRKEEIPALVKVADKWRNSSIEVLSTEYGKLLPSFDQYNKVTDAVVTMAKSFGNIQGREVMNYYLPLQYGFDRLAEMCDEKLAEVGGEAGDDGILGLERAYYYMAMKEVVLGMSAWCDNYARKARDLAAREPDPAYKKNYEELAEIMGNIAHKKPNSFREALQMTLCCHYSVINEDPHSGQSLGRLGQVLNPFYVKDLEDGVITEEEVIELLECHRVKMTSIECMASPAISNGVNSGNTFNNLTIGGLRADGKSAVTPLEYLIVEAGMRAKTTQPTLSLLYDEKLPEEFLLKCAQCIKTGAGYPAIMNNQVGIQFLMRQYKDENITIEDARACAFGGCLETTPGVWQPLEYKGTVTDIPGGACPTASNGVHFISLPKVLELVLTNGVDARTGKEVFPPHNETIDSYDKMIELWKKYIDIAGRAVSSQNNVQMNLIRRQLMPIVNSLLKAGCFEKGQTVSHMGVKYHSCVNFETVGTINFVNSLASIKKNVFDDKKYTLEEMTDAMLNNFGFKTAYETAVYSPDYRESTEAARKYEQIYADCLNAPKYGNDIPYVDQILKNYIEWITDYVKSYRSYYGKPLYLCQISVSSHGPMGFVTMATADGRLTGTTYADGSVSASPSTDVNGLYALFESASVYDHSLVQNSQMNLKLHPTTVKGKNGNRKLLDAIAAYMRKGGFHVQFNIVDSKTLKAAQAQPEAHRDLMVRVAGFTQYWCEIAKPIQDEVIFRTMHEAV